MRLDASACPLWLYKLLPFLRWWPQVGRDSLRADCIAGFSGAMIVLREGKAIPAVYPRLDGKVCRIATLPNGEKR